MEFTVDKEKAIIHITRSFSAKRDLVWNAFTQAELLDQWWAPKPYQTITESMDFRSGGRWFYAMKGPEGDVHYCIADYHAVNPKKHYEAEDAFCDENAKIKTDFPRSYWDVNFEDDGESCIVRIYIKHGKLEDLDRFIQMGFKEGFTMALENLDSLLPNLKN